MVDQRLLRRERLYGGVKGTVGRSEVRGSVFATRLPVPAFDKNVKEVFVWIKRWVLLRVFVGWMMDVLGRAREEKTGDFVSSNNNNNDADPLYYE